METKNTVFTNHKNCLLENSFRKFQIFSESFLGFTAGQMKSLLPPYSQSTILRDFQPLPLCGHCLFMLNYFSSSTVFLFRRP